jgi:hypothetical protein
LANDEHKYLYDALRIYSTTYTSIVTEEHITSAVTSHNNRRAAGSGVAKWSVSYLSDATIEEMLKPVFSVGPLQGYIT